MRNKCIPFKEIAKALERTVPACVAHYNEMVVQGRTSKRYVQLPWSERELKLYIELEKRNTPTEEIADELGRDVKAIWHKRYQLRNAIS